MVKLLRPRPKLWRDAHSYELPLGKPAGPASPNAALPVLHLSNGSAVALDEPPGCVEPDGAPAPKPSPARRVCGRPAGPWRLRR
jgi:hypothetical protein